MVLLAGSGADSLSPVVLRNWVAIAIPGVALVLLVAPQRSRWVANSWLVRDPGRRRYFLIFAAMVLVAAVIHAAN
jgi:hypothetical protein